MTAFDGYNDTSKYFAETIFKMKVRLGQYRAYGRQGRKFEGNLAQESAESASRSCGRGSGGLLFLGGGGGEFSQASASAASLQFTALVGTVNMRLEISQSSQPYVSESFEVPVTDPFIRNNKLQSCATQIS